MLCSRSWSERRLMWVQERLDAPLVIIPSGMLTPETVQEFMACELYQRLWTARNYLQNRVERERFERELLGRKRT